jgi:PAS domain S-box-containing protein
MKHPPAELAQSPRKAKTVPPVCSELSGRVPGEVAEECPQVVPEFGLSVTDILEALPFYVMLVDEDHRILQANGAVRQQLGLEPEEIVGRYCPMVIHGLGQPWYACPLEEAVETGQAVEREALDEKSGRWIRSAIYPLGPRTETGDRIYFHTVSDITDRKEAEEQLVASREQLRELYRFLESVREEERTKMAREIHDELGQTLTALKLDVSWLRGQCPQELDRLSERTGSMSELIDGAIQTVKRLSSELRPSVLDDLGLADAIQWQAQDFGRRTGIKTRFTASPEEISIDRERSTVLFRICQEALTNIIRHAKATRVTINLRAARKRVVLKVSDNGVGIEQHRIGDPAAFGLIGMRERAGYWGGQMKIGGSPGKGTVLTVTIPLPGREGVDAETTDR